MRLKNISPSELEGDQIELYRTIQASIASHLQGFVTARNDGALIGPFNILLHFPHLGIAVWDLFSALVERSKLPKSVREITILMTGARFSSLYELYSHESVALSIGIPKENVAALAVGQRPSGLNQEENLAFDVVSCLLRGSQIPNTTFLLAKEAFTEEGLAEIAGTIGCYTTIATLLNVFDVALPGTELAE